MTSTWREKKAEFGSHVGKDDDKCGSVLYRKTGRIRSAGVGSGDTSPSIVAHTDGDTSQSRAHFLLNPWLWKPLFKKKNKMNLEEEGKYRRSF